ncbi:hypothetical protein GCM10011613_36300 [Cellvibrio zantedeschiae]|uniref:Uncharacterized protein n=1 Tax=Cellvibrio zantedeschiae TaxID=1237077 RepID=A0ABQ3BES9_9GAMM|nr:hypothetical protein [Cellvibrio zantedeschiae]GGY88007.1 hypothetical protein GCM10011613_36300 [Cellvibrio zantedeschiae]
MIKHLIIALGCIAIFVISLYVNADEEPMSKANISKVEYSQIENIACMKPHKIKAEIITASRYENGNPNQQKYAYVKCKPHSVFKYPEVNCSLTDKQCKFHDALIFYEANCSLHEKYWECKKANLLTSVNLLGKTIELHILDITPELAYQTLTRISTYGSYRGVPMEDLMGYNCNISQPKAETIELSCRYKITVSTLCPQSEPAKCPRIVLVTEQPIL